MSLAQLLRIIFVNGITKNCCRYLLILLAASTLSGCLLSEEEADVPDSIEDEQDPGGDTGGPSPLTVVSTQPGEADFVSLSQSVVINFSAAVDPATISDGSIQVIAPSGDIAGSTSVSGSVVTFDPQSDFSLGTVYQVVVSGDISDSDGNRLTSEYSWHFSTSFGDDPPEFATWQQEMIEFGHEHGQSLAPSSGNNEYLDDQYYDAAWVYFQIAEFTGETEPWHTYADYATRIYRDEYLAPNGYTAQGYRRFPHGLYIDMINGGDTTPRDLALLRDKPAYSTISSLNDRGSAISYDREIAYAVQGNIYAERAGEPRRLEDGQPRLASWIPYMGNHLYEWRTQSYRGGNEPDILAPFKFGLSTHALIEFYEWEVESGRDPHAYWPKDFPLPYLNNELTGPSIHWETIVDAMAETATYIFEDAVTQNFPDRKMWVPDSNGYGAFRYQDDGDRGPAPDLNQLIAPTYAWLYKQTGDRKFRVIADKLFGGGVLGGYLGDGKQFNQNYRLAFSYLKWRREGDERWGSAAQ